LAFFVGIRFAMVGPVLLGDLIMRLFVLTTFLFASAAVNSAVVSIDFEDRVVDGWFTGEGPVIDNGFALNYPRIGVAEWNGDTGTSNVVDFCMSTLCNSEGSDLTLSSVNSYGFDLLSLDLGTLGLGVSDFLFTGNYSAGGSVQKLVSLTNTVTQDSGTLTPVLFDENWSALSSVDISFALGSGFEAGVLDNIAVNTVPIPAAAWLFGSALAGLGWMRRRKAA
jgi:hypothetical protein